jgi:lysophospholipase L1-like esterase
MPAVVRPGNLVVFVGDSITQAGWFSVAGGFVDQVNAQIPTVIAPRYATLAPGSAAATVAPGAATASVASVAIQNTIRTVNSGIAGNQTADIAAAVAARITNYNPDVVVLLIGINDITFGVPFGTTMTNYESILSQVRAWSTTVQIACLSVLFYGEQWAAGPVWDNSPTYDAPIDAVNAAVQALCTTYNATYVPVRPQALTYETINNAPAPGAPSGILTLDRFHPNANGQLQIGSFSIGSFTVTP